MRGSWRTLVLRAFVVSALFGIPAAQESLWVVNVDGDAHGTGEVRYGMMVKDLGTGQTKLYDKLRVFPKDRQKDDDICSGLIAQAPTGVLATPVGQTTFVLSAEAGYSIVGNVVVKSLNKHTCIFVREVCADFFVVVDVDPREVPIVPPSALISTLNKKAIFGTRLDDPRDFDAEYVFAEINADNDGSPNGGLERTDFWVEINGRRAEETARGTDSAVCGDLMVATRVALRSAPRIGTAYRVGTCKPKKGRTQGSAFVAELDPGGGWPLRPLFDDYGENWMRLGVGMFGKKPGVCAKVTVPENIAVLTPGDGPYVDMAWEISLGCTVPALFGADAFVAVSFAPPPPPLPTANGTILISLTPGTYYATPTQKWTGTDLVFSVPVTEAWAIAGFPIHVQGFCNHPDGDGSMSGRHDCDIGVRGPITGL